MPVDFGVRALPQNCPLTRLFIIYGLLTFALQRPRDAACPLHPEIDWIPWTSHGKSGFCAIDQNENINRLYF